MGNPTVLHPGPAGEGRQRRPFTPEEMIADKYERLGGEGFFGSLKSKEAGRIWIFENGSCLCYNAQKDAAFEIHGAIFDKWLSLGGLSFGVPCTDETATPDGRGRYNHFNNEHASIYWTPTTNAAAIYGAIHEKWKHLGWERSPLGYPTTDELGTPDGVGRYNHFEHGSIYWTPATGAAAIYGAIHDKWASLDWERSPLGYPATDELGTPDGVGRYNHFEHGSIYWTPATGAAAIYGAIHDKWASLDWERSYLGYPTSDETEFPEGGRVNTFQNGGIYWWSDTGAIDLRDVVVHYTGLHCFGETDWDGGSTSDEPYVILSVATPQGAATRRSQIYERVDAGETRTDLVEIYRGKPFGMTIGAVLMEHDWGDANRYTADVANLVSQTHWSVVELLGLNSVVGPIIAMLAWPRLIAMVPSLGGAVANLLGLGDDRVSSANLTLSPKQMIVLAARTGNSEFDGIGFKVETPLLSGLGASYKAFFGIVPV